MLMRITAYRRPSVGNASLPKKSFAAAVFHAFRPCFLNWRARDVPIGAKHAAIAFPGLEACPAALAHIEEPAGVGRHGLRCAIPTSRARNRRDELHHTSQELGLSAASRLVSPAGITFVLFKIGAASTVSMIASRFRRPDSQFWL